MKSEHWGKETRNCMGVHRPRASTDGDIRVGLSSHTKNNRELLAVQLAEASWQIAS